MSKRYSLIELVDVVKMCADPSTLAVRLGKLAEGEAASVAALVQLKESQRRLDASAVALQEREQALTTRETDYAAKAVGLDDRTAALNQREQELKTQRHKLDADAQSLQQRGTELDKRSEMLEQEAAAQSDRQAALEAGEKSLAAREQGFESRRKKLHELMGETEA